MHDTAIWMFGFGVGFIVALIFATVVNSYYREAK